MISHPDAFTIAEFVDSIKLAGFYSPNRSDEFSSRSRSGAAESPDFVKCADAGE
jgi:hypothetical protein